MIKALINRAAGLALAIVAFAPALIALLKGLPLDLVCKRPVSDLVAG